MAEQAKRPEWWDDECEEIRLFVHAHRAKNHIMLGAAVPDHLETAGEVGYYLFGILTYSPDFTGGWQHLADHDTRVATLNRVRFEQAKPAA